MGDEVPDHTCLKLHPPYLRMFQMSINVLRGEIMSIPLPLSFLLCQSYAFAMVVLFCFFFWINAFFFFFFVTPTKKLSKSRSATLSDSVPSAEPVILVIAAIPAIFAGNNDVGHRKIMPPQTACYIYTRIHSCANTHMGQFLQGGKNGCLMSFFF